MLEDERGIPWPAPTCPCADKRDRGRHRGWAWIDLGGEPDSVPSIRTMFKWTEITVEVSV